MRTVSRRSTRRRASFSKPRWKSISSARAHRHRRGSYLHRPDQIWLEQIWRDRLLLGCGAAFAVLVHGLVVDRTDLDDLAVLAAEVHKVEPAIDLMRHLRC